MKTNKIISDIEELKLNKYEHSLILNPVDFHSEMHESDDFIKLLSDDRLILSGVIINNNVKDLKIMINELTEDYNMIENKYKISNLIIFNLNFYITAKAIKQQLTTLFKHVRMFQVINSTESEINKFKKIFKLRNDQKIINYLD